MVRIDGFSLKNLDLMNAELKLWLMSKNHFHMVLVPFFQCLFERRNCIYGGIKLPSSFPSPPDIKYSVQLV